MTEILRVEMITLKSLDKDLLRRKGTVSCVLAVSNKRTPQRRATLHIYEGQCCEKSNVVRTL